MRWSGISLLVGGGILILFGSLRQEISWVLLFFGIVSSFIGFKILERSK